MRRKPPPKFSDVVEPPKVPGLIYFIGGGGFVKIGWTEKDIYGRLNSLQVGCPHELFILGLRPGSVLVEWEFHERFKEHHLRGEWFVLAPEIELYIETKCMCKPKRRGKRCNDPPSSDPSLRLFKKILFPNP